MKIKINGTKHKLRPVSEMTAKQYIDLNSRLGEKTDTYKLIMYSIAVMTGNTIKSVNQININDTNLRRLMAYVGTPYHLQTMPKKETFYYSFNGKTYFRREMDWQTMGIRHMLQNFVDPYGSEIEAIKTKLDTLNIEIDQKEISQINKDIKLMERAQHNDPLEQMIYLLAIMVSDTYDAESTQEVYERLLNHRYEEVFGFALFFFRKRQGGMKRERGFFKRRKRTRPTNTAR